MPGREQSFAAYSDRATPENIFRSTRRFFLALRSRRANRATRFSTRSEYNPNRGSSRSTTYYDCGNLFLGRVKAAGSGGGAFVLGLVRVLASRLLAFPQCGRGNAVTDGQGALPGSDLHNAARIGDFEF